MANNNNSPPREIRVNVPVVLPQGALLQVPPITYGRQRQATPPAAARPPFICGCGCSGQAASSSNVDGNIGIPDSALHTEVDPTVSDAYKVIYQSISCIKRFRNQSPEEIRLQYLAENPNYRHAAEAQKWPADFALNMLTQSTSGSTYWGLIKWMIKQELPLSLIDNADSQAFFNNSVYQGPGSIREQVIGTLNSLHDSLRIQLLDEFEKLENANGARNLHVALGPLSEKGYATLTVHFLPDGKKSLESVIVDHIHIRRQDNPSSIAQKVHASLTKFNIQNQCHSFIDSTSRSVGDAITPLFPRWNARSHEVHCVVQTLNKFMLAILKPFMVFESDAGDDELDLSALNLGHYVSSVQDSPFFSREVLRKMNKAVDAASEQTVKDAGEVDPKIVSESKLTFAKLLELFSVLVELEFAPFKSKISFTSVEDGHWFTFFKAMSLILDHKPEVEAFLGSETIVLDLEHVKLSKNDWNMLESLGPILKVGH
ncbi:hypothetical protein SISSUDRAFT_828123 [Sistotremastrum suecicum HHB10207 ss-3]|uniref:Uncharacterized protein n=1 Tax=Sistotremastrum suecicum HHB10207 ss-3 TaxID=1314776 RepID=A0A166CPV2_9AGAM|nr:hypothetical protein SISSUDRAFT_828123 [Sistotremastrum suecicum HHB10207 ss-3]